MHLVQEARKHYFLRNEVMFDLSMLKKSRHSLRTCRNSAGVSVGTLKPRVSGILPLVMRTKSEPQMMHNEEQL
jgi:hypothetical protein